MNKKKIKLDFTENFDFYLLGISSFEKDYRLVWNINNHLGLQLSRTDNHQAYNKKAGTEQGFLTYKYIEENTFVSYHLIANKSDEGYLLEELKNIDFFLLIQGEADEDLASRLRREISSIENVQAVFQIEPETLKNRQRLPD